MKNNVVEFDNSAAVDETIAALEHPLKPVVEAIRRTILAADRRITEGIKWNSPSFYCNGWFVTLNLRARDKVIVVLHHGAKSQVTSSLRQTLDDSAHLLNWLSTDRATVTFFDVKDFEGKQMAFNTIIQQWAESMSSIG